MATKQMETYRTAMERELLFREWTSRDRSMWLARDARAKAKVPRFTFTSPCKRWRILTDSEASPWWTVHKMGGSHVQWTVDFPFDVGMEKVFEFIELFS